MSRLSRVTQKIFGINAGFEEISQFGSLYASAPLFTTNIATIQALSNYLVGWFNAAVGDNSPAIEDMNSLFYLITTQMVYQFQSGIPEWDSSTAYYSGSLVNYNAYIFTCTSANATVGATYTNNANTFTVVTTIAAGTTLLCTGTGVSTASGTLTKTSGTGDATITFSQGIANSGIFVSTSDANTGNAVTNTSFWRAVVPTLGLPYQKHAVNAAATGSEYTYFSNTPISVDADITTVSGYTWNYGALTVPTGRTLTVVSGSAAFIGGDLTLTGDLVCAGDIAIL